jgi:LacI family transcriptional regulator
VARAAGVSPATVSRVLNHPKIVRAPMRRRVEEAIETLGFKPHAAARALKSRRSLTIGAVVPTLDVAIFAAGIAALQGRLREKGYTLLIASSEYNPRRELEEIRVLLERGVDGIVVVGDAFSRQATNLAREHGVPLITTYVSAARPGVPAIGVDNAEAMFRLARHLIDLGHREFGVLTDAATRNDRTRARREGLLRALGEAAIELPASRVVEVSYSVANGRRGLRTIMALHPEITAVVCTSDALAIGALTEARALGYAVPRDLSITGYDDIDMAAHTEPPLTTVHVPAAEIGRRAADHIMATVAGDSVPPPVALPAPLVLRGSSGAPGAKVPAQAGARRSGRSTSRPGMARLQSASAKK